MFCVLDICAMYTCTRRQNTPLVITAVSLRTSVSGNKNVHADFSLHLCIQGWGCIGNKLTKGHQFRRVMAALQSFV